MYSSSAAMMARVLGPGIGVVIRTPRDLFTGTVERGGGIAFRGEELDDIETPTGSYEGSPLKGFAGAEGPSPPE
jgi:hypothetical protein